jgi:alpha-beta hydrolase superfamily lysophospholipase
MGMPESIILKAQDGVRIAGTSLNADQPQAAALLLHMMPATKESWSAFASRLSGLGIASLAIDLRGHGDSTQGPAGPLDYRLFDDADHQASRLDVDAGLAWLRERYPGLRLQIVGASIGANLALRAMADHPDVSAVLAFSTGLEYRGVQTEEALKRLREGQRVMLIASRDDSYAFASLEKLKEAATQAQVETLILDTAGHGTAMLEYDSSLAARASDWLKHLL